MALVFAMVYPSLMAWLYFVVLAGNASEKPVAAPPRNPLVVGAYSVTKVIQFAFPLIWVLGVERRRLGLAPPTATGLRAGLAFGLAVGGLVLAVYWALVRHGRLIAVDVPVSRLRIKIAEFGLGTPAAYVAFGFFLAVIHSFLEEYYWRWFVFGGLQKMMPLAAAIVISSVAFMAHHVIDLAVILPGYFWAVVLPMAAAVGFGGAFWARLYARTGSLYAAWLSHLLVDAAIMTVGYDLIFNDPGSR
jgi:membrane protease YdiL (CAAX protease family)